MKAYTVKYKMDEKDSFEKQISFLSKNKESAYDEAWFQIIPEIEGKIPFYAYIYSVTYQNGNYKLFTY